MAGNVPRWSTNSIPANDISSHYSATFSDISVEERIRNPDIGQRLHTLFEKQLYTDVKFVLSYGVKPKPTLMAHRAILSIGSIKFREMFYDKMSNALSDSSEIQINNVTFEAFRNVIEYLYTDDVIFENDQIVIDTLSAATIFQVQPLVDKCESYIESVELTEDNVCTKFQMAINKGLSSLKMRCTEFIQENTGAVLRSKDFLTLNPSIVRAICKLEKFNLRSEIELLNGIVYYVENRPDYKTNRRAGIETFLRHIRLLNVTCEEFNQFVQRKPNIFSAPEAANILMSIANPANPAPNLPSWCKRGNNRCKFHFFNGPRGERVGYSNVSRKLVIALIPIKFAPVLHDLICILEMKCTRGYHRLQGLKLSFDDPVYETSVINDCIINVEKQPGNFKFEEYVQIEQSKDAIVKFSQRLFTKKGDCIVIRVRAKGVKNYRFLQFDERNSFSKDSPFSCVVGSVPNDYKMFIIREVLYCDGPPPRKQYPFRKFGIQELNVCRKLLIQLKPNKSRALISDLVCILEMKCLHGRHNLDGLKLSFDVPVHERSIIGHLIISVDVQPSRYHFEEHIQIKQSETIDFKFSRRLMARKGDTIYIRTVAKEVNHYRFLQYDENYSISKDSPFSCSLGSVPKENRLFIISEVLYRDAPRGAPSHRSRASRK